MTVGPLRLMTWNVQYASSKHPLGDWSVRGPVVRETIASAGPDVLCLQEIDPKQLDFARHGVTGYEALIGEPTGISAHPKQILFAAPFALAAWAWLWTARGEPPWPAWVWLAHAALITIGVLAPIGLLFLVLYRGPFQPPGEFMPILYRPERLRSLSEGSLWLSNTPARRGSAFPLLFEPRVLHWARFAAINGDAEFLVINAHFGHAPWHYEGTARVVLELVARERPSPDAPVFLLGDFNAVAEAGVVQRLTRTLRLAWEDAARREGPTTTFQWNLAPNLPLLRLDHVLYAGEVRVESARVLTPRVDGKPPSDHDPLVVDFAS